MKEYNLDADDRKCLRQEIGQVILMNLAILMAGAILVLGFIFVVEKAIPGLNRLLTSGIPVIGYIGYFVYSIKPRIKELKNGVKGVSTGLITDKKKKVKYGWSGTDADFITQPKLTEYFFTIDNQDVWVEEKYYDQFNINDRIDIHMSIRSGRIIRITKAEK